MKRIDHMITEETKSHQVQALEIFKVRYSALTACLYGDQTAEKGIFEPMAHKPEFFEPSYNK